MSVTEIAVVIAVIGYSIVRQVGGEPLRVRRLVLLPLVLTVVGFADLHLNGGHLQAADITCLVIGTAGSALIGCGFGGLMRLESREGYLWARLPVYGLWLWVLLVAWRVAMMATAGLMHAHIAASTSTLLFSLGVNRLGQAAVIVARAAVKGVPFAPEQSGRSGGLLSGLVGAVGDGGGGGGSRDGYDRDRYDRDRYDRGGGLFGDRRGRSRGRRSGGLLDGILGDDRDRDRYDRDRYERDRYEDRYDRDRDRDGYDRDRDRYDRDRYGRDGYDDRDRDDRDRDGYGRDRGRGRYDRDRDRYDPRDRP